MHTDSATGPALPEPLCRLTLPGLVLSGPELIELDATAVRASVDLVAQLTPADLTRPTPCAGWTLHGLLAHMTTQHYGFAAAAAGQEGPGPWRLRLAGRTRPGTTGTRPGPSSPRSPPTACSPGTSRCPSSRPGSGSPRRRPSASTSSTTSCIPGTWPGPLACRSASAPACWPPRGAWPARSPAAKRASAPAPPSRRPSRGPGPAASMRSSPSSAAHRPGPLEPAQLKLHG